MTDVRIVMTGHGRGEVFIDGRKVEFVRAVAFRGEVNEFNEVRLTLGAETVSIEGPAEVVNPPAPFLLRTLARIQAWALNHKFPGSAALVCALDRVMGWMER